MIPFRNRHHHHHHLLLLNHAFTPTIASLSITTGSITTTTANQTANPNTQSAVAPSLARSGGRGRGFHSITESDFGTAGSGFSCRGGSGGKRPRRWESDGLGGTGGASPWAVFLLRMLVDMAREGRGRGGGCACALGEVERWGGGRLVRIQLVRIVVLEGSLDETMEVVVGLGWCFCARTLELH